MNVQQVFYLYGIVIVEFLAEFSIFAAMFLRKLYHRKNFALRVLLCAVILFAAGIPVAWFYTAFGSTLWGRMAVYLALFALFILLACRCFEEKFLTVFFCCSMAYAVQNLVYKLYLIIWTTGEYFRLYDGWGARFNLYYRLMYYGIFAACAVLMWFGFIRRISNKIREYALDSRIVLLALFILAITIFLCSVEDLYFAKLSVERENRFAGTTFFILRQTGNAFSVICCTIVLLFASKAIMERELLREVEYLKYSVRQGERQYRISKDTIDLINVKCHDIKYKLDAAMAQGGMSQESFREIKESISIYDCMTETGNPLLNTLITEKSLYCEQNGITLSCMIDGELLQFIEGGDLYCLFGNLLDNALEAVKQLKEKEKRVINLVVKAKDGLVLVQEENYFGGALDFKEGLPVTTKADKTMHGFGMRSISMIVKKYGGELTASVTRDIFHLNILFTRGHLRANDNS